MTDIQVLARRRLSLAEQRESIDAAIAAIDAQLTDAIEVGGKVEIDGQPVFKVQQRRTFDVERARQLCPPEVIAAATVPTLDTKALKHLLPAALIEQCMKPGAIYVSKA